MTTVHPFTVSGLELRRRHAIEMLDRRESVLMTALDLDEIVSDALTALRACQARIAQLEAAQGQAGRARPSSLRARPHLSLVTTNSTGDAA